MAAGVGVEGEGKRPLTNPGREGKSNDETQKKKGKLSGPQRKLNKEPTGARKRPPANPSLSRRRDRKGKKNKLGRACRGEWGGLETYETARGGRKEQRTRETGTTNLEKRTGRHPTK